MDPNQIVGTPSERWIWLAPDWSAQGSTQKDKTWTHVRVRDVTYADGRVATYVLDENGKPVAAGGVPAGSYPQAQMLGTPSVDPDQKKIWDEQQQTAPKPIPPGGSPTQRQPDGSINSYNPQTGKYDIPTGTYATPQQTPDQARSSAATATKNEADAAAEQALNNERSWNSQHGYGWVTHAERETAIRQQATQARADNNQDRMTKAQEDSNQLAKDRLQFDKDKANLPDIKVTEVPRNGQNYTHVVTTTPKGEVTIQDFGPDHKPVERIPSEGAALKDAPPLPDFVHQAAATALVDYHTKLQQSGLSPEQQAKLFQEANQIAQTAVQQAGIEQRQRESERNASSNEAKYRLDYMQSGTNQALSFVNDIIKSGSGSQAGGAAFTAIMGLTMLGMTRPGIDSVGNKAPLPVITPADVADPNKAAAKTAEVSSHIDAVFKPQPPVNLPADRAGAEAARQAAAAPGAAPSAPQGAAGAPAAPSAPSNPPQIASQDLNPPPPSPVAPTAVPNGGGAVQLAPSSGALLMKADTGDGRVPDPHSTDPNAGQYLYNQGAAPQTVDPSGPMAPNRTEGTVFAPNPQYPRGTPAEMPTNQQQPYNPPEGDPGHIPGTGWVGMAPTSDWQALAAYAPQPRPQPQPDDGQPPAALLAAKIKSTPPWRLSDQDLQWAHENGLLDDAMAVPGRVA